MQQNGESGPRFVTFMLNFFVTETNLVIIKWKQKDDTKKSEFYDSRWRGGVIETMSLLECYSYKKRT